MIIGISGKMGAGKDTAAAILVKMGYLQASFAQNLKSVASIITGIPYDEIVTREVKRMQAPDTNLTVAQVFQLLGNGIRNILGDDIWIKSLFNNIKGDENVVISDVRYLNEAEAIRKRGGIIIRIERSKENTAHTIGSQDGRDPIHVSETELDRYEHFSIVLDNNGTIEDLEQRLIYLLAYFM